MRATLVLLEGPEGAVGPPPPPMFAIKSNAEDALRSRLAVDVLLLLLALLYVLLY